MWSFFLLCLLAGTAQADAVSYTIEDWPSDLNTLPCTAFVKAPNGGWALAGTIVVRSSNEVVSDGLFVKGNTVANLLESKCGNPFDPLHLKSERTTSIPRDDDR
jgi:hypothetical protein